MPELKQVSFTTPYSAEEADIERRRRLAEALQMQGQQPLGGTEMVGGWAIPRSPLEGAAKMAQSLSGAYGQSKATEREKALTERYQNDLSLALQRAQAAGTGSPARTIQPDPQEAEQSADQGTPPVGPVNQPAVAPDRQAMIRALIGHPATQPIAMQQMGKDMEAQQRQAMLAQILGGGQPGQPASGQPQAGGFGAGIPPQIMGLMTSGDPELAALGKSLLEANKGIAQRAGAPVVNPFTGAIIAQPTPSVPQGVALQVGPGGPAAYPVPGAIPAMAATAASQAGAQEAGRAPYQTETVQTEGAPTMMTRQQAIEAATGQPMPNPAAAQQAPAGPASFRFRTPEGSVMEGNAPSGAAAEQVGQKLLGTQPVAQRTPGLRLQDQSQTAANTEAGKEFIAEMRQNYAKLRDVPATLANMDRARELAASQARQFMGPFGESKLAITKFMRSNVPGMANVDTTAVTSAEQLQSTLFNQVMDNLKKMDASPSQYQQQVMQEAFGTLRTDPQSVPKILDVFEDILRNRVTLHNQTVTSAESRGTTFPYDVSVKLPEKKTTVKNNAGALTPQEQAELQALRSRFGR